MSHSSRPAAEDPEVRADCDLSAEGGDGPAVGEPASHLLVQAPVPPMDVDGFSVTILGLVAFAVASVVTAVFHGELAQQGNGWWLGVCLSGFGLGLVGLAYCLYRRNRRRAGRWDRD